MSYTLNRPSFISALLLLFISPTSPAATLALSDLPLFTTNSTPSNVFFELDDSGSMDWEVMTQKHWPHCSYDPKSDPHSADINSDDCGDVVDDGSWNSHSGSDTRTYSFIFDNADNVNAPMCNGDTSTLYSCDNDLEKNIPYQKDWRILSSAFNTTYFDPEQTYIPWAGPCSGTTTACADANFSAARSNPREGEAGYTLSRDLEGAIYEVWGDDKGYDGERPRRGNTQNSNSTSNGKVDLWDSHIQHTFKNNKIVVKRISYAPNETGLNPKIEPLDDITGTEAIKIRENYANWYQYYRKRSYVAKAAIAAVVDSNPDFDYGLSVINEYKTLFTPVPASDAVKKTHNTQLLADLFSYNWINRSTPLRQGLERTGKYFDDELANYANPIKNECQKCFTLLITDGYWNGSDPSVGDKDGDGYSNTLADVAKYYYDKDLDDTLDNHIMPAGIDTATHQHMVTYTIAFGLNGNLIDSDNDGWPDPALTEGSNWGNPKCGNNNCPEKIDDLWHAAFNSKGNYLNALSSAAFGKDLIKTLQSISKQSFTSSASSLNTGITVSSNRLFLAKFNSDNWHGQLLATDIKDTGEPGDTVWDTDDQTTDDGRPIYTYNSNGIAFYWDKLNHSQKMALDPVYDGNNDTTGIKIINYLRGGNDDEISHGGSFRDRPDSRLGDIVNSSPTFAGEPGFRYPDDLEGSAYSAFRSKYADREPVVYVGANDGMLHGFNAETGAEEIAYVPSMVIAKLSALSSPDYTHQFTVDGTPTVGDAFFDGKWRTLLVGGLNNGGQGVYALNITDPSMFGNENNARDIVLWEFSDKDDADLGYTYSQPNIVKMANDKWAAVFGNGYNNTVNDGNNSTTGNAVLYIVDIETGELIRKIDTGIGMDEDPTGQNRPNGLATVAPADIDGDYVIDVIYGGDLFGNLWKFDVKGNKGAWHVALDGNPLFTACEKNNCNNRQAITSRPEVGRVARGQGVMVYFGTGKFLENNDRLPGITNTFYSIWDKDIQVSGRGELLEQTINDEVSDESIPLRITTDKKLDIVGDKGWFIDLDFPSPQGERVIISPLLRNGRIIFTTFIPETIACAAGGSGWFMELNAFDGSRPDAPPFDINIDLEFTESDLYDSIPPSGIKTEGLPGVPGILVTDETENIYLATSSEGVRKMLHHSGFNQTMRQSWQQLK